MPISQTDKEALIDELLDIKRKSHKLEINLKFQGKHEEAKKIREKANELSVKIDELLARSMEDWLGEVVLLKMRLEKAKNKIEDIIQEIKNNIEVAQKIVEATGNLDDAISVAVTLLS